MIRYYDGTVFNSGAQTLVNTVNCSGVMGTGIALEFKLRYPGMFNEYKCMCDKNQYKVGRPMLFKGIDRWILNFPTKNHWRYPSKLKWIEEGLKYFVDNYKEFGIKSIAFPKLGTSNGGLSWNSVKNLMEKYLDNLNDIEIFICLDEMANAEGIENKMIQDINSISIDALKKDLKLKKNQLSNIYASRPFKRFRNIRKLDDIGEKTYEKLFDYFYKKNYSTNEGEYSIKEQLKFDI